MALDIGRRRLRRAIDAARRRGPAPPGVVIVGGGLSGLAFAIQLVRSGMRDFTIIEQAEAVGGTWRDNTYPGSGCDVPSHLYSFSFTPKSDWTRRFAEQPEILSYAERWVARYRLGPHLRLGHHRAAGRVDEAAGDGSWSSRQPPVRTGDRGRRRDLRLRPAQPAPHPRAGGPHGLRRADVAFGPVGPRVDLAGKRVAVVGSGASAIQFVPPVAELAGELTIYQRSPNYVGPKKDRPYGEGPDGSSTTWGWSNGPTGGGSTGAWSTGGSGSARMRGPGACSDSCSPRKSVPRSSPSACPSGRWSPTTRSAASASSSQTTGTRR